MCFCLNAVVLDDHFMVGQAIAGILSELAGFNVLAVCRTADEACQVIEGSAPDLLVLDIDLGGDDYRLAADLILRSKPDAQLLFITAFAETFVVPDDLLPITIGVVSKADAWDKLIDLLQLWWVRRPEGRLGPLPGSQIPLQSIRHLCPREVRLLEALGRGLVNKEIALELSLTVATVETYRKSVASKLGVSGSELVRIATLYRCWFWEKSYSRQTQH